MSESRLGKKPINKIIGDGKRFMAYEIVKRLNEAGQNEILLRLQNAVETKDKQRGKKHEVWEDSFDFKICRTEKFMNQKLAYMHANPCTGKWKLANTPIEYEHSSARFYITGKHAAFAVTSIDEILKIVLNNCAETTANAQGNE